MYKRQGHGPFTCRLGDELVDMAIDAAGEDGIAVHYNFPKDGAPEFVQTFAQWMEDELGITPNDELRVAMYAHAANGGIRIDAHAKTSVPGLFADVYKRQGQGRCRGCRGSRGSRGNCGGHAGPRSRTDQPGLCRPQLPREPREMCIRDSSTAMTRSFVTLANVL